MTAQPGISFEVLPPAVSGNLLLMQQLYQAYAAGPDNEFANWWDFNREVKSGHIVPALVYEGEQVVACFGVELMTRPDPWLNLLFYQGRMTRPIMREMVWRLYLLVQVWKNECGRPDAVGGVRIVGRPGWRKVAASMGIEMDRRGFVFDNQERLRRGYLKRFI